MQKTSILFICTGNICRSPTAEGIFRNLLHENGMEHNFTVDSAGLISYHAGKPPDPRTRRIALNHNIDLSDLRARVLVQEDFKRFDWIIALDMGHLQELLALSPAQFKHKIRLLGEGVPDPYFGNEHSFEAAFTLIEDGIQSLFRFITEGENKQK